MLSACCQLGTGVHCTEGRVFIEAGAAQEAVSACWNPAPDSSSGLTVLPLVVQLLVSLSTVRSKPLNWSGSCSVR